jgi:hypothetical protein
LTPQWAILSEDAHGNVVGRQNYDGRLEVFGIRPDKALWHMWEITPGEVTDTTPPAVNVR